MGPAGRARSAAGSPAFGPSFFRERVGFQSNAYLPSARSTGNLRAHEGSGASRRELGMGETPRDLSGWRGPSRVGVPAGLAGSSKWSPRSSGARTVPGDRPAGPATLDPLQHARRGHGRGRHDRPRTPCSAPRPPVRSRLLRPFPSTTLLHSPLYEKKERSRE